VFPPCAIAVQLAVRSLVVSRIHPLQILHTRLFNEFTGALICVEIMATITTNALVSGRYPAVRRSIYALNEFMEAGVGSQLGYQTNIPKF
jgi:Na+-transporting NADH:ubiquinone oxidoreductase subunit NqrD